MLLQLARKRMEKSSVSVTRVLNSIVLSRISCELPPKSYMNIVTQTFLFLGFKAVTLVCYLVVNVRALAD